MHVRESARGQTHSINPWPHQKSSVPSDRLEWSPRHDSEGEWQKSDTNSEKTDVAEIGEDLSPDRTGFKPRLCLCES